MKNFPARKIQWMLIAACTFTALIANAQQKTKYNVAIFLYQGVELLDFAGPGEVFSSTKGFNVYTVSIDGSEILSQGFVTVKPQYSIDNAPAPDIIVLPGGASGNVNKNQKLLNWVNNAIHNGNTAMSVCTGASILAKAGLLDNLNVTTHHGFLEGLQQMSPSSKVLEKTRFVDNGNIITTAGVSAGIDGALHLISKIKGTDIAEATAWYMEYEKWNKDEGRVDDKNAYIEKMQSPNAVEFANNTNNKTVAPYIGQLKDASQQLWEKGMYEREKILLDDAIKWYPNEGVFYSSLADVYTKLGKPAPINEKAFLQLLNDGKVDEAIAVYNKTTQQFPGWLLFSEDAVNLAGYAFLQKKDYANAIKIFELNVKAYPQSGNVYDSLGDGYLDAGDKNKALMYYKKSLELDPSNTNAKNIISTL